MSITAILQNSLSGLNVAQSAMAVVSQNVANANTVGYSRQIVEFEARIVAGISSGVTISGIERVIDDFLVRELQGQTSVLGAARASAQFLTEVQSRFGSPGGDSSLSADLAKLGVAFDTLTVNPEDAALRFGVVAAGAAVARSISALATDVQKLRTEADKEIKITIDAINSRLRAIDALNSQIARARAGNVSTASLEDQRDREVARLAENIAITTFERDNGALTVLTAGGLSLVDVEPRELDYTPAAVVSATTVFGAITIFRISAATGQRIGGGIELASSGTSATVTDGVVSGRLKGLIDVRDGALDDLAAQVESIATQIRDQYNDIHNSGVSFPAPNSLTGTRDVTVAEAFAATGSVRIAVLDADGTVAAAPLDLDLAALGATTVGALATAIDAALGADGSAAVVNGRLVISATDPTRGIAIHEDTSQVTGTTQGFSRFFGLNDFFTGSDAATFAMRQDIVDDPSRVAVGELSLTAAVAEPGAAVGDNRVIERLSALTNAGIGFAAVAGLPAGTFTLGDYAAAILGLNAVQTATATENAALQQDLFNNLQHRQTSQSGVNIDEEMANMVVFQNAFSASARVLAAASEMFDTLINIVG